MGCSYMEVITCIVPVVVKYKHSLVGSLLARYLYSRNASVRKNGILFAPEVGVTTQKWPLFARERQVEESRWSAAKRSFAGF